MKLVKCPRCDLNYIREDEKYCKVCLREMKGEPTNDDMELCSVCNAAPALPGRPPPAHTHPAGPAKAVRLALPAGCTPRGGLNPWARAAGDRGPLSRRKSHNQTGN